MRVTDALPIIRDTELPNGQAVRLFIDPLTQQPYQERTPPRYLLENAKMRRGFEYLETHGDQLEICLLLARHRKREDLTRNDFESKIAQNDYYSHEGYPFWRENVLMSLGHISMGNEFDKYHRQILRETTTPHFSHDLSATQLGRMLLRYQNRHSAQLLQDWKGELVAFQFVREWSWVPTLGHQLSRRAKNPPRKLQVLMSAGLAHSDIERKLSLFGASVTAHIITEDNADDALQHCQMMTAAMQSGMVQK